MLLQKSSNNQFVENSLQSPNHVAYDHPFTKWLLNTLRHGANYRLSAMMKERPLMFRRLFQIFDSPAELSNDPSDTQCAFHSSVVLYLTPLSLAIYMRCKTAVQILLNSNLCNPMECSYASNVYVQSADNSIADLLEISPAGVALRRQFLDVLPLLFRLSSNPQMPVFSPRTAFSVRYVNRRIERTNVFTDVFHYATDLAQNSRRVNIVKILEVLVDHCENFYSPGRLDEQKQTYMYSLFRRLVYVALYVDTEFRISSPLVQCMNLLIRRGHFQQELNGQAKTVLSFKGISSTWNDLDEWSQDCHITVALLFSLYASLHQRRKSPVGAQVLSVLFRVLVETNLIDSVFALPPNEISNSLHFILKQDHVLTEIMEEKHSSQMPGQKLECTIPPVTLDTAKKSNLSAKSLVRIIERLRSKKKRAYARQLHASNVTRNSHLESVRASNPASEPTKVSSDHAPPIVNLRGDEQSNNFSIDRDLKTDCLKQCGQCPPRSTRPLLIRPGMKSPRSGFISCEHQNVPTSTSDTGTLFQASTSPNHSVTPVPVDTCDNKLAEQDLCNVRTAFNDARDYSIQQHLAAPELNNSFTADRPVGAGDDLDVPRESRSYIHQSDSSSDPDAKKDETRYCEKSCQVRESTLRVLLARTPSMDYITLRDIDQLVNCITTKALQTGQGIDNGLLEELFKEYIDHDVQLPCTESQTDIALISQESHPGNQTKTVKMEDSIAEPTTVTPIGETRLVPERATSSTYSGPDGSSISSSLEHFGPTFGGSDSADVERSKNTRSFFWSCAKPICQLNLALDAFKQRRNASRAS